MLHRALKSLRPLWPPQPERRGSLSRPLPWLILLALLIALLGISCIARIAIDAAAPHISWYGGDLTGRGRTNYSYWPVGPLIPPINPAAIAAPEESLPGDASTPPAPGDQVPIVVVAAPTSDPLADTSPSPTPSPTARVASVASVPSPTRTATATVPVFTAAPARPSATPDRRPAQQFTATATATPIRSQPSTPPQTQPSATALASTALPTRTSGPTASPALLTPVPATITPTPTNTPSPTVTPDPRKPILQIMRLDQSQYEGTDYVVEVHRRDDGNTSDRVTVQYRLVAGSATPGRDYTIVSGSLSFPVGITSQSFTIPLLADALDEPNETLQIVLEAVPANSVSFYGPSSTTLTILDRNEPPVVRFASAARTVGEADRDQSLLVTLSGPSGLPVTVPYTVSGTAGSSDHLLRSGVLRFEPEGANPGQTRVRLNFSIVNDRIDEDDETIVITLGQPTNATVGTPGVHTTTITDNDTAGVTVTQPQPNLLAEGDPASISYGIRLDTQPTAPVTITVASPDRQLTATPSSLIFDETNWDTDQIVTVRAVDDPIDEDGDGDVTRHTGTITHSASSTDPRYNAIPIDSATALIRDNDTAGVIFGAPGGPTVEGGATITYTVRLTTQPVGTVTVNITPLVTPATRRTEVSVSPDRLDFTAENWQTPQLVTVTAIDDRVDEDGGTGATHEGLIGHTTTAAAGTNPGYNGRAWPDVTVQITDNDTAGLVLSTVTGSASEDGATATYTVRLATEPVGTVTVTVAPTITPATGEIEVSADPVSLTFNATDWNTPQTVTVAALNDLVAEGDHNGLITHTAAATADDRGYQTLVPVVQTIDVTDNDAAGLDISPLTPSPVDEGATATYTVQLATRPIGTVTVNVASVITPATGKVEVSANSASLTFNRGNWDTAQTVTVTAIDDLVAEGDHTGIVTHTVSAAIRDAAYAALAPVSQTIDITDNDTAGVIVSAPSGTTTSEAGATVTFNVRLNSQPPVGRPVNLPITVDDATEALVGTTGMAAPAASLTLIFDATNWITPQQVTVIGQDDSEPDLSVDYNVRIGSPVSTDPIYAGLAPIDIRLTNLDNPPDLLFFNPVDPQALESSGSAQIGVRLSAPALTDFTISYTTRDGTAIAPEDYTATSGNLTFHTGDQEQSFTIPITNDAIAEALLETVTIELRNSAGTTVLTRTMTIVDDDTPLPAEQPTFLRTPGPASMPIHGGYYTENAGYNYNVITIPCSWPRDRAITIELFSPAINDSGVDAAHLNGLADTTWFELYGPGTSLGSGYGDPAPNAAGTLTGAVEYLPVSGIDAWENFYTLSPAADGTPIPCGNYLLRSQTSNDDENYWGVRVLWDNDNDPGTAPVAAVQASGERISVGLMQNTIQPEVNSCTILYSYVHPGMAEVSFHNYDMDYGGFDPQARISYYPPGRALDPTACAGGDTGTASEADIWNGAGGTGAWSSASGDHISNPVSGWWRIAVYTSQENSLIVEAREHTTLGDEGVRLPLYFVQPQ